MFKLNNYYYPADGESVAIEDKELSKDETIKFLNDEDNDDDINEDDKLELKPDAKDKEDEDNEEDEKKEDSELDEIEEELEEPAEEDLELTSWVSRKEILAKYPKLFKDFPQLQNAYYRERAFTEIIPTIDDAKEAVAAKDVLEKFQNDLNKGDLSTALKATKAAGDNTFNTLVDNYLPSLAKVDKEAYFHIIGNVIKSTIMNMNEAGKNSKDDDLVTASNILSKFIFNTEQPGAPTELAKPKSDNDPNEDIKREREALLEERFNDSRDQINTRVGNTLKSYIESNIDPKESMTDYVKRTAIRDCQERLETALEGDKRLGTIIDRLWIKARDEKFSKSSLEKIKSAYLSGAKTLLPTVLKQARNEALKGLGKRVRDNEDEGTSKKGPAVGKSASSGKTSERSSAKSDREKAAAIPKGMSTADYLNSD